MYWLLKRFQRHHIQRPAKYTPKFHVLPTFKAPQQSTLWMFGHRLYIRLIERLSYRWFGVWRGSKQRFWGSNQACNFGTSHKNEVHGCIQEENAKKTSNHASLLHWLQCCISRLWPFGRFYTTINLSGNFLAEFLRFGQRFMGHHGRYGDRFVNWLFFTSTMDAYGSIEALITGVVWREYFPLSTYLPSAPFLDQIQWKVEIYQDGLVLKVFFKDDHFQYSRLYLN